MKFVKQMIGRALHGQLSKFDAFYQKHAGEECYIFGSGPSLKWMDLHQFTDRPVLAVNNFLFHKEASALHIPYGSFIEPFWFWPILFDGWHSRPMFYRSHNPMQLEFRKLIKQMPETVFFINISNYPVVRYPNVIFVCRRYVPPFEAKNPFRVLQSLIDPTRSDFPYGSFEYQVALAIYLGFKKAYFVGMDKTHVISRGLHFYDKGEGILEYHNKGFRKELLNYAKQYIDLVTVTLDGDSDTMESITYKELTGKEPAYRENVEIVDMVKLKSMVKWPAARIF